MEWHIMNASGVSSLATSLGSMEEGEFIASQNCEDSLNALLVQVKGEDASYRNIRRQIYYSRIVEKELVPMLKFMKDEPTLYALVVKLMSVLTQPVECLVNMSVYSTVPSHPVHIPWQKDLEASLRMYRKLCSDRDLLSAMMTEINTILMDNEGCELLKESCEAITDTLLFIRNLLHLPEENEDSNQNKEQELFLWLLFQSGLTERVMSLLNLPEREVWSVPMVQMISLLYKGHVGEMFYMDLRKKMDESLVDTMKFDYEKGNDVIAKFESLTDLGENIANNLRLDPDTQDQETESSVLSSPSRCSSDDGHVSTGKSNERKDLRKHLLHFAHQFLEKGFSNLVNDLKHVLISRKKNVLDDVYLLWLIAFFLKFARYENTPLKTVRTIFSTEIFGFLVYEGVLNMEHLLIAQRKKKELDNTLRRIHMTVDALREMLQFLKICQDMKDLDKQDATYLDKLKGDLTNMFDLRQFFLLLIRYFQLHIHSLKFLCDIVVTNHLFLLLMEFWINKGLGKKTFNMLNHVKQFATVEVMKNYGILVENVEHNSLMVNNCVFTMMHHVAGDCGNPEVLLQVHILKAFLDMCDKNITVTQEMEDLMEYVLQSFMLAAESNPLSCAIQLFGHDQQTSEQSKMEPDQNGRTEKSGGNGDIGTDSWSEEEEDLLMTFFTEYQDDPHSINKILSKMEEYGVQKSKEEIIMYLAALDWIPSDDGEEKTTSQSDTEANTAEKMDQSEKFTHNTDQSEKITEKSESEKLALLKEAEIIPYCIKQLQKEGFGQCIDWLRVQFCEVAYSKYVSLYQVLEKHETEEPIARFHVAQNKSVPLVLYNEMQEHVIHNKHFITLMLNLGLYMPEDVGMVFPRIPHWWSIQHLIDNARQLGRVLADDLKFDLTSVKKETGLTSDITDSDYEEKTFSEHIIRSSKKKIPDTLWMDMVQKINKTLVSEKVHPGVQKHVHLNGEKNGHVRKTAVSVNNSMDGIE